MSEKAAGAQKDLRVYNAISLTITAQQNSIQCKLQVIQADR